MTGTWRSFIVSEDAGAWSTSKEKSKQDCLRDELETWLNLTKLHRAGELEFALVPVCIHMIGWSDGKVQHECHSTTVVEEMLRNEPICRDCKECKGSGKVLLARFYSPCSMGCP